MKKTIIFILLVFLAVLCVYGQTESYLVYRQMDTHDNFYVNLEHRNIVSYAIKDEFDIYTVFFTRGNFQLFKDVINRFIEWESIASSNTNLTESFEREIPITVLSNNVTYSGFERQQGYVTHKMIENEMQIKSTFYWNPAARNESDRGKLSIISDGVTFNNSKVFRYYRYIMRDEAKLILENLTDAKIQEAIQRGRAEEQEKQRQRQLQEELFR